MLKLFEDKMFQPLISTGFSQCHAPEDNSAISELRIVLLGDIKSGKSSAVNTILGQEKFQIKRTAQCVKRQGEVAGRHITVVKAPGWRTNKPIKESTELLKNEIVLSVSLCPPGPHALLLVIRLNIVFAEVEKTALMEHLKLLTDKAWSHTIVLFTHGDCLGDTPIEKHIQSEGQDLQWLVVKCRNRYHVLNNMNKEDGNQITQLLEKIEEMVAANSGQCFEMDQKIHQEVEEKRRSAEEGAKERMMKIQKQREDLRSQIIHTPFLSEVRIVLLGCRYAGKSATGDTILGRKAIKSSVQSVKRQGEVAGRHITVVETPGWSNRALEDSSEALKRQILLSVSLCPPGPHCLMLVIRVDNVFKENEGSILNGHVKLFNQRVWSHMMVLFTFGDYLGDTPIEQHIESEGKTLQWLVEKCRNRYHVLNNLNRDDDTQVTELLEKIEEIVLANMGCHFKPGRTCQQKVKVKRKEAARAKEKTVKVEKQSKNNASMGRRKKISNERELMSYIYSQLHPASSVFGESSFTDKSDYASLGLCVEEKEIRKTMRSLKIPARTSSASLGTESKDLHNYNQPLADTEVFIPEILENTSETKNKNVYRFQCPHAGQFQCKFTSLVFEMEGKGEVLYSIDSWDYHPLDGLSQMLPAGPLYNIYCFEGSISYLQLPHCEILTGGNPAKLVVAHCARDNIEIIQPLKMTDTHVIIRVEDLSIFGILKDFFFNCNPISAQVLLFYEEISCEQSKIKLLIHLLPRNVPVEEVEKRRKTSIHYETSSMCKLTPGSKYRPFADPYESQPEVATFDCDYGPNYHPTFVMFFEADGISICLLDEEHKKVWGPQDFFPSGHGRRSNQKMKGAEFVDEHSTELIQRVSCVLEIADSLQSQKMITTEMYNDIRGAKTSQKQMRMMCGFLQSAGWAVKEEFYNELKKKQPFLVKELESGLRKA